jgi:hypothetical protein
MGCSCGAAGVEDELCPYILDAPSPTAHPTSRIRLRELNKRECMRLSSATIWEVKQKELAAYGKARKKPNKKIKA